MTSIENAVNINFFATPSHACGYLPDRIATTVFVDPDMPKNKHLYSILSRHGFRRSGEFIYRPECAQCNACVSVRVPVRLFQPNRNQRRTWRKNRDLETIVLPAEFRQEHFELYRKYISARHAKGGMDNPNKENYQRFLIGDWSETHFLEFRLEEQLAAVAVIDVLDDGLSAVYTFYDPDLAHRSLGRYTILYEIEHAKHLGLNWLYLGYWIEECKKMSYKREFKPQQRFTCGHWDK